MRQVFAFFKSIFWRKPNVWVTLGDFTVKSVKLGREICIELKIENVETKCGVQQIIMYMCHICVKGFLNSNFNLAVIDKVSNLHEIGPKFTYSQKS